MNLDRDSRSLLRSPTMSALPSYRLRAVHLVAVWAYAVSQPIFSLLQGNPEFLVVRGATRSEVIAFALLLTLVPPLAAVLCEWLVSRVSRSAGDVLHLVFLGAFFVPLGMLILKKVGADSTAIVFVASTVAVAVVAAYLRWRAVRSFFTLSTSLAFIGLVLFVARAPLVTEDLAGARVRVTHKNPVVVLVLDQLPLTSLTTPAGDIDGVRYPNFARLAHGATWYPRTTTVHDSTTSAVPAIVTGKLPRRGALPALTYHPENLFTLLGEAYHLNVHESLTYLCPKRYCPRKTAPMLRRLEGLFSDVRIAFLHHVLPTSLTGGLPRFDDRWRGFSKDRILAASESNDIFKILAGRPLSQPQEFADFLADISPNEPGGTLHFVHLLLPHSPWRFLPSGRNYGQSPGTLGLAQGLFWSDHPWLVRQGLQRHLLQVGYTDTLLGQLLRRLKRSGLYDRALVVVVADHGASFAAGGKLIAVSRENIADIAPVPLLIKFPQQKTGRVDPRAVRTIDILPTIADVLGVTLPWSVDGHSLLEAWVEPTDVSVGSFDGTIVQASSSEMERGMEATLGRKAVFGSTWDSLLATGLPRHLVGLEVGSLLEPAAAGARIDFDEEELFAHVDTSSSFVPARITGTVRGIQISPDRALAVAVNGRIAAATRCFRIEGEQRFSALVPETAFRDGFNRVELVSIEGTLAVPRFTRLGHNGAAHPP
jgi:hypothetical protein